MKYTGLSVLALVASVLASFAAAPQARADGEPINYSVDLDLDRVQSGERTMNYFFVAPLVEGEDSKAMVKRVYDVLQLGVQACAADQTLEERQKRHAEVLFAQDLILLQTGVRLQRVGVASCQELKDLMTDIVPGYFDFLKDLPFPSDFCARFDELLSCARTVPGAQEAPKAREEITL